MRPRLPIGAATECHPLPLEKLGRVHARLARRLVLPETSPITMKPNAPEPPRSDALLDVGETLCGELALLLRTELSKLEAGQVLEIVARDPAAPQDLPAWCELTGHVMAFVDPPRFWIRRRPS